MSTKNPQNPKALLFDIGGVCVVSPFQAILNYEIAHSIPPGYVNYAISRTAPNGAWQRLERGEIPLDDAFFAAWAKDLASEKRWREFWLRSQAAQPLSKEQPQKVGYEVTDAAAVASGGQKKQLDVPPVPRIDTKAMFWEMMRTSRAPDPWMFPALVRLRNSKKFILGGLSNTVIFPAGIRDERNAVFESGLRFEEGGKVRRVGAGDREGPPEGQVDGEESEKDGGNTQIQAMFDVFVSSAHVGMRKPDPAIYKLALEKLDEAAKAKGLGGLQPGDVLFIDDIGQNLRTARELGMRTLKVELGKAWKAVRSLEDITGLVLLEAEPKMGKL
ncbi:hypothetical protein W97_03300 [Coniosporium apollinis CBS 100218]|uniref:Microsomal epoxide hydrolase n=1 Tax=Coniosporium apollinis (strain CBS 100218) TaxID=1168221 RepID=R7YQ83_CONA1|nr:uncharacterized protein W97_03300 [Coniosporium apollinis CBS 100218]EON64070.1 hypothetical protein W97_03300 [Coniosporium apollinis CBS 100218]